jgi:ABC-type transport system involved in multi-copper enzyme maturation permease subunit
LFAAHLAGWWGLTAQDTRNWLTGLVFVEFATILLVATNVAASSISRERESQTLDLLLSTPLTSRYIIWGKLRGLVSFTLPLICVPVLTCGLFSFHALLTRGSGRPIIFVETAFVVGALMIVFSACACMLGLYRSLMSKTTMQAMLTAIGILVLACGGATMCGLQIVGSGNPVAAVFAPFTPFTIIFVAINPEYWMGFTPPVSSEDLERFRIWAVVGSVLAATVYGAMVHAAYRAMVRNFDMTIRKQSV